MCLRHAPSNVILPLGARFGLPLPARLDTIGQHGGPTTPLHRANQLPSTTELRVSQLLPQLRAELPPVLLSEASADHPGMTRAWRGPREEPRFDETIQ